MAATHRAPQGIHHRTCGRGTRLVWSFLSIPAQSPDMHFAVTNPVFGRKVKGKVSGVGWGG
jgi:hypothetical protein